MKTIWKFELVTTDSQSIDMPTGAEILAVQIQNSLPCLWVLLDPNKPYERRTFAIYGTGNPVPDFTGNYIDTYQLHDGALVFHVFEVT